MLRASQAAEPEPEPEPEPETEAVVIVQVRREKKRERGGESSHALLLASSPSLAPTPNPNPNPNPNPSTSILLSTIIMHSTPLAQDSPSIVGKTQIIIPLLHILSRFKSYPIYIYQLIIHIIISFSQFNSLTIPLHSIPHSSHTGLSDAIQLKQLLLSRLPDLLHRFVRNSAAVSGYALSPATTSIPPNSITVSNIAPSSAPTQPPSAAPTDEFESIIGEGGLQREYRQSPLLVELAAGLGSVLCVVCVVLCWCQRRRTQECRRRGCCVRGRGGGGGGAIVGQGQGQVLFWLLPSDRQGQGQGQRAAAEGGRWGQDSRGCF